MRRIVHRRKVLKIKMGINLSGGQIRMTQQLLHPAQIAARLQHMGRERVAQLMRMHVAVEALLNAPFGKALLHVTRGNSLTQL